MVPAPRLTSNAVPARGTGTELLLLRSGTRADLERSLALFAGTALALVLSAPAAQQDSGEHAWAASFARARSMPHELLPELAHPQDGESDGALAERAWPAFERILGRGLPRILAVLSHDVLRVSVACALGIPFARSVALRVDPGRLVVLRDDPIGLVLRRSNVLSPADSAGTALPSGRTAPAQSGEGSAR